MSHQKTNNELRPDLQNTGAYVLDVHQCSFCLATKKYNLKNADAQ